ncbi:hypothetical protein PRA93_25860, partial [Klebsiella pneumoniae]|nr:hypothetical protein [Klebsiella pneumoniae]
WLMMSLWDALRMNMMISYQELVRTFLSYMDISNYISVPEKIVKKRIDRAKEKVLEVYPSFRAFVTDCYRSRKIYFFIENVYEYVMLINC